MRLFFRLVSCFAFAIAICIGVAPIVAATAMPANRYSSVFGTLSVGETTTEKISYTRKEYTYIETYKGAPLYVALSDLPNSCGAIAGAEVVGFYDRYFEELIPDYQSYITSTGYYKGRDSVHVPPVMRELYTLMRTNIDDVGVSDNDCLNGLKYFFNARQHSLAYRSVRTGKCVDEEKLTEAVQNNHPVLLFCGRMDLYLYTVGDNVDTFVCTAVEGGHVAVAYGISIFKYYNGDTLFRTEKYVRIATGLNTIPSAYLKITNTDWCNGAYEAIVS